MVMRSPSKRSRRSAYWTLTATSWPSRVTARCTCAIDAAPMGVGSMLAKTASYGCPNSSWIVRWTSAQPRGLAWSCSTRRPTMYSSGRTLLSEPMVWPSLIYRPPLVSEQRAMRCAARSWQAW